MKSYLALAWKELKAQKITAILILVAVIMSTIMTTVIGQSIGILQSMRIQQAAGLNGNRYATFHQLGKEQAQKLHEDDRLYDVGDTIFIGSTPLGNSSLSLYLREYHDNALSMYPAIGNVKEGRLPEEAIEIALSEDALQYLGLDAVIGDTVSLDLSVSVMDGSLSELEYSADFVLTGILESSYIGYASGTVEGIVGEGTAEELLPEEYLLYSTDFKTYDKQNFQSIIYALAEDLNVDERYIQYNWVLLDAIGISYDEAADSDTGTGFSFMTAACILVGVLVLLAAGLVIYNILKISITKRIKEYGTLRAIGGERGQIYRLVSLQLLILCGAGIPIGLLLGILSAKGVLIAATGLLNPDLFMANSTSELNSAINTASTVKLPMLFASIAVILLFALLAAFPAARYASHVSPTVAMSGQTVKIKRRIKRNRNIRNFEAYYARLNLKRGRGRTAVTILSLVMSITVFVALQSFTGLLDASSSVQDMYFSDYAVTNETVGIPSEAVKTLAENDAVESVSTTRLSVFMPGAGDILPFETDLSVQSHETLQLVNVDEAQLQIYAPNLSAQDKQALKDGTGCLVKNPIAFSYGDTTVQQTDLTVGDTIQLGDRTLPVLGLIDTAITINNDGFTNGVQLIVNDEIYCSLLGNDSYSEVYPTLQDNADTDTFESWLDSWCSNYPGTHWLSYLQSSNEMIESFEQIKMLCWVLIIFSTVQPAQQGAGHIQSLRVLRCDAAGVLPGGKHRAESFVVQCGLQQHGQICRTGIVFRAGQAGAVGKVGVFHAQLPGFPVHQSHKGLFAAAHLPGQRLTALGAGRQHGSVQQIPHRDRLARLEPGHGSVCLVQRGKDVLRQSHRRVQVRQRFRCQQHRHHLGQGGRSGLLTSPLPGQDLPGPGIHQQRVSAGRVQQDILLNDQPEQQQAGRQHPKQSPISALASAAAV